MSDAIPFYDRLRYTPMCDVLRGRLTGRLDVKRHIDRADIPTAAKELIERVVRRTHLRPQEKLDVADELIAHFADGLGAGATIEELLERFGDERIAAKLIARAKRRSRPFTAQLSTAVIYLIIALALSYAVATAVFFAGKPRPIVAATAPEPPLDQQAMPLYLKASKHIGGPGRYTSWADVPVGFSTADDDLFAETFPPEYRDALELVRQSADKPVLGTPPADVDVLSILRWLAWPLGFDAQAAAARGDRERVMRDLRATIVMAGHARRTGRGVAGEMLAASLLDQVAAVLRRVLEKYPAVLSDDDLQSLAHQLAPPKTAADLVTLENMRRSFAEVVARAYTDDRHGGGRLTPQGLAVMGNSGSLTREALRTRPLAPAAMLIAASREELVGLFDRTMDDIAAHLRRPRRETNWSPLKQRLAQLRRPNPRYPLLAESLPPAPDLLQEVAESYLQRRDGVMVGIALELYRRKHGNYPASLSELSPAFLPAVPIDRMSAVPLKYRLVDGKPVVYSVSFDRDDDGGYDERGFGSSWDSPAHDEDDLLFGTSPTTRPSAK